MRTGNTNAVIGAAAVIFAAFAYLVIFGDHGTLAARLTNDIGLTVFSSLACLAAVAAYLDLAPSDVMGVVTFYDMYHERPVGRHRIRVCTNLSCMLRGAEEIMESLEKELGVAEGEVSADGRCSFVHFECLGSCDTAPMMMVDDEYHENLTPESAARIVRELK